MTPPKLSLSPAGWVVGIPHHDTPNQQQGMGVPAGVSGVVMHTMVGNLPGTDSWFMNPASQVSAHFGIAQDGTMIQWVNVRGGIAWHCAAGNPNWYGIEHADNGNPANPLTPQQIDASAQLVELLSRDDVGRFPLQEANSTSQLGYGVHYMGGAAWGGHTCPGPGPRAGQRTTILTIAKQIREGTPPPPTTAGAPDIMEMNRGANAQTSVALPPGAKTIGLFSYAAARVTIDWRPNGIGVGDTVVNLDGSVTVNTAIDPKVKAIRLLRDDAGTNDVSFVVS